MISTMKNSKTGKRTSLKFMTMATAAIIAVSGLSIATAPEASAAAMSSGYTYIFQTPMSGGRVLDVPGASIQSGVSLQLYDNNQTAAQRFTVTCGADNWCTIMNVKSRLVLDVQNGYANDSNPVWQYTPNGTNAQKWRFNQNSDGTYTIVSALRSNLVLDLRGAGTTNGTALQVYSSNGTAAQKFKLYRTSPVATGTYTIQSTLSGGRVLDVPGASTQSAVGIQLYDSNGTGAQKFNISCDSNEFCTIQNINSKLNLDVQWASTTSGTPVWQYTPNGTSAQKWYISQNADGSMTIHSVLNISLVLDVKNGGTTNGTPLQIYTPNGTAAQKFLVQDPSQTLGPRIVAEAQATLNQGKTGSDYGLSGGDWCAAYVTTILERAGSSVSWQTWAPSLQSDSHFIQIPRGQTPQPGDLAFWDSGTNGVADHVNIVISVSGPYSFTTIGGNESGGVRSGTAKDGVFGTQTLIGFARPIS